MSDLISRQAVLNELTHALWGKEWDEALAKAIIESVPTIDPAENGGCWGCCCEKLGQVKHGKWIPINERAAKCSLCGEWEYTNGIDKTGTAIIHRAIKHYCPNCGARMERSEE